MNAIRVAVVQDAPVAFDLDRTIVKTRRLAAEASAIGAKLIVFPEAFVSAYPRGLDFGATVGSRSDEGREWYRRYWASAIDAPGPATIALGEIAREAAAHVVIGAIERDGGTLYCSVLFLGPDGALLGKRRKVMPTASERLIWGFGDGSTLKAWDAPFGPVGAVICWENYMPLLRMHMYAQGVRIYCAPTADGRDTWLSSMRHVALEGRCFVLSSNQFATRSDYPADYPAGRDDPPETVVSRGGSCVIDPLGRVVAGPNFEGPAILSAELDLDEIPRAKFDFDAVGHYARPDLFRLVVDDRARKPASTIAHDT